MWCKTKVSCKYRHVVQTANAMSPTKSRLHGSVNIRKNNDDIIMLLTNTITFEMIQRLTFNFPD